MMSFKFQTLKVETNGDGVWILKVNRPEAMNALNSQVLNEFAEFFRTIGEMDYENARALIITGEGEKAFVAGADIREISELSEDQAQGFAERGQSIFHEISHLKIPVIAAINGFALGGGLELALACDFIIASENAKMGLPEVTLGLIPGFGGTVRLFSAIGLRKARELTFTGDMLTAAEALNWGLVNQVVPQNQLLETCRGIVQKILQRAPLAVSRAKESINKAWDLDIDEAQKTEARHFADLFRGSDVREGTKAFLEKRKPHFKGQ
jgi:enoyl-CoA hydratase